MKKIIAMAIAALFITVAANAQIQRIQDSTFEKNRPHQKMMVKDNWNNLNLTDAQKKQMKDNQESFKKQQESVRNDASLTQEQKKAKMMELQKANREKNNKILTADQKATMKASQKERRSSQKEKGQHHMKNKNGMKKGQGMKGQGMKGKGMDGQRMEQLGLSQDQQSKMTQLRTKMQEQTVAIKNDTKLTEEEKKQQINDLRAKNMEQMNQLLTPEQKLKMKENRGDRKEGNKRMKNRMEQSK